MIEWEASSGNNPFSKSILKSAEINSSKRKVVTMPTEFGFDLTIYPKEEDMYTDLGNYFFYNYNKGVIVGVDTARGTGDGDYSVLIFIDAVKLQKEPEKKNRVRVTLHYGDEIQSIVEAIADTIDGFGSSSECPVQRNPYPIFLFRRCLSFYPCL